MKRLPADEKRHFCYTSAVKVAFNFCYTSVLKVPSSSIKLQKAFSVQRELLHGFARDLRESARARSGLPKWPAAHSSCSKVAKCVLHVAALTLFGKLPPSFISFQCFFICLYSYLFICLSEAPRIKTYFFEERPLSK